MKYISKCGTKEIEVIEITKDNFVRFITDGLEVLVAKKRFDKIYEAKK